MRFCEKLTTDCSHKTKRTRVFLHIVDQISPSIPDLDQAKHQRNATKTYPTGLKADEPQILSNRL
ncbi:hypothetical protein A6X21_05250 [Planctopirus hydrillae]|uniref:Uncharacterized protein n=1 Tax=Planctopirus hydrillae TaxID=1841610 RepID=A0A1C3ECB3_9PLAN|nr:hypothetical protein A6X21_05250 [Planctopirus hydrillae]